MKLTDQKSALLKEGQKIAADAKGEDREFTDEEVSRLEEIGTKVKALTERIEKAEKAQGLVEALSAVPDDEDVPVPAGTLKGATFGDRFVKSAQFQAFAKANPSGVGNGSPVHIDKVKVGDLADLGRKTLITTADARAQNVRFPDVDLVDRPPLTLLDLITRGSTAGNFEYLQITSVTRNAAIVPETSTNDSDDPDYDDGLKPISTFGTNLADAKVFTYADGYDVTNQMLADHPGLATFLSSEMSYSLPSLVEDYILNGSGAAGNPRGILATSGVQSQSFDTDMFTTVRKAITRLSKVGAPITAVVMSPEDDEAWDLARDDNERFYGQGPFGSGPNTAWGRPRVVSQRLQPGTVILGNWATVALLDREGLSITAFNQHKDYAQRNLTYVRAELRAAQTIWKPAQLCVAATSPGSS